MKWTHYLSSALGACVLLSLSAASFTLGLQTSTDGEPSANSGAGSIPVAVVPTSSLKAPQTGNIGSGFAPGSWQALTLAACARRGCDGLLLVAIGSWEPDARGTNTWSHDQKSWGQYGMTILTAACNTSAREHLNPVARHRCITENIGADEALDIAALLRNPVAGADLAAQELARCSTRWHWPRGKLRCWNGGVDYAAHVMPIYKRLRAAANPRIALEGK